MKPAEQNFWQIDHFGESLTVSAPPCLDSAKTNQSTRFELSRCLGTESGLVRLVRAPNCRLTSVFESPTSNSMGVFRSFASHLLPPTRPSRELQSKQKGNCGRIPSLGPAGPTSPVIVSARDQKAAEALKPCS